ncbi:efflux RND transporter periplasmic adaptor subunit [Ancylobacter polymorphus]|uniref:Efflux RND transporter periplasmic adaptor subunit n=1 Tax=Ancylobacter polymorphus TaxID=223390 RepID=A0A9E7CX57_9HYPH|nr:efflux RND transporter periplasmic adaptor subunit [Ancylobacter polymorphus]UOK71949.1 efflux RND transporter periplasmic adaptor subunit [Ancylobacter polymorphus]
MKMGSALRVGVTLLATAAAVFVGWRLWLYYTVAPWTRDARVLAQVVAIAPDVSGLVDSVNVRDNQFVRKGEILFVIDQQRFTAALRQAQADVELKQQALRYAGDTARRDANLERADADAISAQTVELTAATAAEAQAELDAAEAALTMAQINLERSRVRAPTDGYITNFNVDAGDYARVGEAILALVDSHSFYVYAYFMETKLPSIRDGDPARVELMAGGVVIDGEVEGLSRAIANPGQGLLAQVDPNFDWIRLAQRIPVRIKLGPVPPEVRLVAGLTATVVVQPRKR